MGLEGAQSGSPGDLHVQVLGALRVLRGDESVPLGGPKQRLVLALLVLESGRVVSVDRLIDGVWPHAPPRTARKTLQGYLHHLRNALGDVVRTESAGYMLALDAAAIDATVFETEVATARTIRADDPLVASETLRRALARWHGHPFDDLADNDALSPAVSRLVEARLAAVELRIDAELDLMDPMTLVPELESLTREHPYRERLRALHMLALYRSGRQAEALRSFHQATLVLRDDLGLDVGEDLLDMERRILSHDPSLVPTTAPPGPRSNHISASLRGYEVRRLVGEGSLGSTYLAYQSAVGREVALKVVRADVANRVDFVEYHDEENRRIGGLDHDGIVPLADAWREPAAAYVVHPWMSGGSLADRPPPQSSSAALSLLEAVAAPLEWLHRSGEVHGRIKPSNVLLDDLGNPRLTDLGQIGTQGVLSDEQDRYFLAPEVQADVLPPTEAADVYGLAALAYLLLTGAPWNADAGEVVAGPGLPAEAARELTRALHPDPAVRHRRCAELVRGLRQALGVDVEPPGALGGRNPPSELRNPYKGLRAFQQTDADDFFGRDELIEDLLERVERDRFVAVVGPSGVGKSSVVKAGLIPALRRGADDTASPLVAEMFPGSFPFDELAAALLRVGLRRPEHLVEDLMSDDRGLLRACKEMLPDGKELLLAIDQFEELFTLCDDRERDRFATSLKTAVTAPGSRLRVVATLRADYYDRPLADAELAGLFEAGTVIVRAPERKDLEAAIVRPAARSGIDLEPGLVAEVVRDVISQPGGLPLLQYALTVLFAERDGNQLTIESYRRTGGVPAAIGQRAEDLYQDLPPAGRAAIRQTFLRLVAVGDGASDLRRRVRRRELMELPVAQNDLSEAIRVFGADRLLSFDRDPVARTPTVEVAHEALLAEWPRLRGWIDEQRNNLVVHRSLARAVREWDDAGREPSYLLGGNRLGHFEQWERETSMSLTTLERRFLDESRDRRDRDDATRLRGERRLRRLLTVVSGLAVVALLSGGLAFLQASRASSEASSAQLSREQAETRRLALEAPRLVDSDRSVALLLAVEAWRREPGPTSLGALQQVLTSTGGFLGLEPLTAPTTSRTVGPGGEMAAAGATDIRITNRDGVAATVPIGGARLVALTADGERVAVAVNERVVVAEVASGRVLTDVATGGSTVSTLGFSDDGALLGIGDTDGRLLVIDTRTGRQTLSVDAHPERSVAGIDVPAHQPDLAEFGVRALAFDAEHRRVVTSGLNHVRTWAASSGVLLDEFTVDRRNGDVERVAAPIGTVGFLANAANRIVAASSFNIVVRDLETGSHDEVHEFDDRIGAVSFPDVNAEVVFANEHVVVTESGGRVEAVAISATSAESVADFDSQLSGQVIGTVTPDTALIRVAGAEGLVTWALDGSGLIASSVPNEGRTELTFDTDGSWLALSSPTPAEPILVDLRQTPPAVHGIPRPPAADFAFLGVAPGLLTWNEERGELARRSLDSPGTIEATYPAPTPWALEGASGLLAVGGIDPALIEVFEPDGSRVAILDELVGPTASEEFAVVHSLSISPDGRLLVGSTADGRSLVWSTDSWEVVAELSQGAGQIVMADFSPDGRWLVTVAADGRTFLRDPTTFQVDGEPLVGQVDGLDGVSHGPTFSADGRVMITTSDGAGRLWDLEERTVIGSGFPSDPGTVPGSALDGTRLGTFRGDQVLIWDLDLASWPEIACRAAGRNLTESEWEQFGPADVDHRATCRQWPMQTTG